MSNVHDSYDWADRQGAGASSTKETSVGVVACHDSYSYPFPVQGSASAPQSCPASHPSHGTGARVQIVPVKGVMDAPTRRRLWAMMSDETAPDVIVDLCEAVPDLAGTGMLLAFLAQARQRRQRVVVLCPEPLQYKAFLATSFKGAVRIASTQEEALGCFTPTTCAAAGRADRS